MNENHNHPFSDQHAPVEQAPSSLMPALLARLGLDGSGPTMPVAPSLSALRKALADADWTVRAAAIERLEDSSDWISLDLLLSALRDEDETVRAVAVRVLGKRGDPADRSVREHLAEALHDPAWHVRETAVYALGELGAGASILALSDALHDSDDEVRRAAIHVIDRLHSDAPTENGEQALSGWSENDQETVSKPVETPQISHTEKSAWPGWMQRLAPHADSASERELAMLDEKQEKLENNTSIEEEAISVSGKNVPIHSAGPRRRWLRTLEQGLAAVLVLGIVCGWVILTHLPRTSTAGFSDAGAPSLGAPTATYQGNIESGSGYWSPDSRTFVSLQVDTQKNTLDVRMIDAATGQATVYPVLDGSWIPALEQYDDFEILQGRYLVAERPQSKTQATLEIWDITGQRAVTVQTVPGYAPATQLLAPFILPSENEQKFAMYTTDGKVTIWDVATGHQVVCDGTIPFYWPDIPRVKWYDHDQVFLLSNADNLDMHGNPSGPAQISAWNTATGKQIINLSSTSKTYANPLISPDSKFLALPIGTWQKTNNVTTLHADTLEILDAHSGQVLHNYALNVPKNASMSFDWMPDSQHLAALYLKDINPGSSGYSPVQAYRWDAFTGQKTLITSQANDESDWVTQDGQYLVIANADNSLMQIWQTSSGRKVATIVTPGFHDDRYSFYEPDSQHIVMGTKDHFDIWDIATGKLEYKYKGPTPFTTLMQHGYNVFWSPNGKYLALIEWPSASDASYASLAIWRMP